MSEWASDVKELGDKIAGLTVTKAVQLRDYLKEVYKIEPAAGGGAVMMAAAPAAAAEPVEKKTEFNVVLDSFDAAKKIGIIKVVRELTGLGLKEAKDLVEGAPKNVKENVPEKDANEMKKKLEEAGAKASLK